MVVALPGLFYYLLCMYINTTEPRARLRSCKTDLIPLANELLLTVPMRYFYVLFLNSMFVRFLLVVNLLFTLFRIALWPSAGKELSTWLFTCVVLFSAVLVVCVPFPFGVWDRVWNPIVSVPDHSIFICLVYIAPVNSSTNDREHTTYVSLEKIFQSLMQTVV